MNEPVDVVVVRDTSAFSKEGTDKVGAQNAFLGARTVYFDYDLHGGPNYWRSGGSLDAITEAATSLLSSLIKEREALKRNEIPIIIIAHGYGGLVISQMLQDANDFKERVPGNTALLGNTYGVLFVPSPRPHRGLLKLTLLFGQLLCCVAIQSFEICRGVPKESCRISSLSRPSYASLNDAATHNSTNAASPDRLLSYFDITTFEAPSFIQKFAAALATPLAALHSQTTTTFVCFAMAHCVLILLLLSLRCRTGYDQAQHIFVLVGLIWGIWTSVPSWPLGSTVSTPISHLSFGITMGMLSSAGFHWLWRILFCARKSKLEITLGLWIQDLCDGADIHSTMKYERVE